MTYPPPPPRTEVIWPTPPPPGQRSYDLPPPPPGQRSYDLPPPPPRTEVIWPTPPPGQRSYDLPPPPPTRTEDIGHMTPPHPTPPPPPPTHPHNRFLTVWMDESSNWIDILLGMSECSSVHLPFRSTLARYAICQVRNNQVYNIIYDLTKLKCNNQIRSHTTVHMYNVINIHYIGIYNW